jgi:predicted RNase H-like HicB family nuclease
MRVIAGYVKLTFLFRQEQGRVVGVCEELGTSAYGDNLKEAIEALEDLTVLHLNALESTGQRVKFFRERNISLYRLKPKPKRIPVPSSSKKYDTFSVEVRPVYANV